MKKKKWNNVGMKVFLGKCYIPSSFIFHCEYFGLDKSYVDIDDNHRFMGR